MNTTLERKWAKQTVTKDIVTETPVTEAPEQREQLYPNRVKLKSLLIEHETLTNVISEFELRLQLAELDLNKAVDDDNDTEIDRYQGMVSVFNVKLSAKKTVISKLLSQLPTTIASAANEYSTALLTERERRASILAERVADTLQADKKRFIGRPLS